MRSLLLTQSTSTHKENSPWCSMAWSHMFLDPTSRVKPCCRFDGAIGDLNPRDGKSSLADILRSPVMQNIRASMLRGERVEGCRRCYEEEDSGKKSLRQRYNERNLFSGARESASAAAQLEWIEISFSNLCNLACRYCDSRYSNLWFEQEKNALGKTKAATKNMHVEEGLFATGLDRLKHVKFTGGEPLLDPKQKPFLERLIATGNAAQISLNYSTNCTVVPDARLIDLWSKFSSVEIILSIDSIVAKEFEYIRWPAKLSRVLDAAEIFFELEKQRKIILGVHPTVSYLNISKLGELALWWRDKSPQGVFNPTHLTYPRELSLTLLPGHLKNKIYAGLEKSAARLSQKDGAVLLTIANHMMSADDAHLMPAALEWISRVDAVRKQDFFSLYPQYEVLRA